MQTLMQIRVDWLLIARGLLAVLWGIGWALVLQHTRLGQFWVKERTWITVVIGVGVDLVLSFGGDWWTVMAVVAASSLGIIGRSLLNESNSPPASGYRVLWGIEDIMALTDEITVILEEVMSEDTTNKMHKIAKALAKAHRANAVAKAARRGEYIGNRK